LCGIGSSPAGGKLGNFSTDFDLKNPTQSKHTTSKPTSILLQDASSPRQQAKTMYTSAHVFILYDKTNKSKRVAYCHQQFKKYSRKNKKLVEKLMKNIKQTSKMILFVSDSPTI
jgi:hypothetical protein